MLANKSMGNNTENELSTARGLVAIVEDDHQLALALGHWFDLHNLQVAYHLSGESLLWSVQRDEARQGLTLIGKNGHQLPLLGAVVDLNLPGITGFELAHSLRGMVDDLPMLVITALRSEDRLHLGSPPTGVTCLEKPFDLSAVENALSTLFH